MFKTFFAFELRYWLRGVMVFLFLGLVVTMVVAAMSTDNIVIGNVLENTNRNSPFNIQSYYSILAILTCLTTTAFVNDAASRDFAYKSSQIIFTKPISKFSFLMSILGRCPYRFDPDVGRFDRNPDRSLHAVE